MAMPAAAGPGSEGLQRKRKAVLQKSKLAFPTIPFLFFMHGQAGAGAGQAGAWRHLGWRRSQAVLTARALAS